jgi:hypothetical protein
MAVGGSPRPFCDLAKEALGQVEPVCLCGWNYKVPDGATRWRSVHGYDRRVFRRAAGFRAVTYEKAPALFGPGPVWMLSKGQAGGAWQGDKAPGI